MPPPGIARTEKMADGLTVRQRQILDLIASMTARLGMTPCVRELAAEADFRSPTAIVNHLKALKKKGFVDWQSNKSRSLKILKGGPSACTRCGGTGREPEQSP